QQGMDGLEVRDLEVFERTNYPLNLSVVPFAGLQLRLCWDRRRYDLETAERLLGGFHVLLAGMASGLDRPVEELSLFDDAARRRVLAESAGAAMPVPDLTLDVLLGKVAAERGDALAIVGPDGSTLSYRELWEQAGGFARRLRELGVGPEVRVGLCLERSPDLIAAMLGVWRAGRAWVPLDPEYPAERLRFLIEDSAVP